MFNYYNFTIMDDRKITEKESLELIASMIQNTKKRMKLGSGNVLLAWGYITTAVALVIGTGIYLTGNYNWGWLWFAIPVLGYPIHYILIRKASKEALIKTSIDRFMSGIWTTLGIFFATMMATCLIFTLYGHAPAWGAMYLIALPCCGFGTLASGTILQEKSLQIGGVFSMLIGGIFIICHICHINIFIYDIFMFALCFALMMIIPGHIINNKIKSVC